MAAWLGAAIGGIGSYLGAKKQADAVEANNAIERERFNYQKALQEPTRIGATTEIANAGQFAPFVQGQQQAGLTGVGQGSQISSGLTPLFDRAATGYAAEDQLARTSGAPGTLAIANQYFQPFVQAQTDIANRSINEAADKARRESAIDQAARGGSLSSQAARAQGQIESQRQRNLSDAATGIHSQAYNQALQQARQQQQYQGGLARSLAGRAQTGAGLASNAFNLGSQASQAGVNAPFLPFNAYQRTVSGLGLPNVQINPAPSPLAVGLGSALNIYDTANSPQGG